MGSGAIDTVFRISAVPNFNCHRNVLDTTSFFETLYLHISIRGLRKVKYYIQFWHSLKLQISVSIQVSHVCQSAQFIYGVRIQLIRPMRVFIRLFLKNKTENSLSALSPKVSRSSATSCSCYTL